MNRPISIFVDPSVNITEVERALEFTGLSIVPTLQPNIYVINQMQRRLTPSPSLFSQHKDQL